MGLEPNPAAPVLGIVSRLTHQKGFETLYESMPILLSENDLRLVVLGSGERQYVEFFDQLTLELSLHGIFYLLSHFLESSAMELLGFHKLESVFLLRGHGSRLRVQGGRSGARRKNGGSKSSDAGGAHESED